MFPFFFFSNRNPSLFTTRMDQPAKVPRDASNNLVLGYPPLRHGLRRYSLRTRRTNRRCCSQFPRQLLWAPTRLTAMSRSDPQSSRVSPDGPTQFGTNPDEFLAAATGNDDDNVDACRDSWIRLIVEFFGRYGHNFVDFFISLQLRESISDDTCSVTPSRFFHTWRIVALLIGIDCLIFAEQHDGSRPHRLRVCNGGRHLPRGAARSFTASLSFRALLILAKFFSLSLLVVFPRNTNSFIRHTTP